jgi:transketolase
MDAVERAHSGHPGMPMGMADVAEALFLDHLRFSPAHPNWPDRDRFVLSNGHGSMLLYAVLHLTGYDLTIEDLKAFRQLHSRTPGHPEHGLTPGVETTTGPLGQGFAHAVGMALAERRLAHEFNRQGHTVVDHRTYVFVGDGDLMEGVSHEAASLAGSLGLGRLVVLYDDNGISIDGAVDGWFRDDTPARFRAYGWRVLGPVDGLDGEAVSRALGEARTTEDRPILIPCRTVIGYGAPDKEGTAAAHGSPLGPEEVARARARLGWSYPPFVVPPEIYAAFDRRDAGARLVAEWEERFAAYRRAFPDLAAAFERRLQRRLPADLAGRWDEALARARALTKPEATRRSSRAVLGTIAPALPELFGGSADLSESNSTLWEGAEEIRPGRFDGRYLHYGVREFAMVAAVNGLALHGGLAPFGATFLVFSDYARNALRLAALMRLPAIYLLSHDSIALGEDGPTHQPIEQLASLRLIPGLTLWRPADAVETVVAWRDALERRDGPTLIVLSRQSLPPLPHPREEDVARGAYVVVDPERPADLLFLATGSEVALAVEASRRLASEGKAVRVVSMPSREVFERQDADYRERILPAGLRRRLVIEAGASAAWAGYAGPNGAVIGLDRFGLSAPGPEVERALGFDVENVCVRARALGASPSSPLGETT